MTVLTVEFAAHTAYLHEVGIGCLVRPASSLDVWLPLGGGARPASAGSLQAADWDAAMAWLTARGWQPSDPDGDLSFRVLGMTPDGLEVIALVRDDLDAEVGELLDADRELRAVAGLAGS